MKLHLFWLVAQAIKEHDQDAATVHIVAHHEAVLAHAMQPRLQKIPACCYVVCVLQKNCPV